MLDLRPVYHRPEDRIRAHVLPRWLTLLPARVTETSTGDLADRPHQARPAAPGHLHRPGRHLPADHRTDETPRDPFTALTLEAPRKITEVTAAAPGATDATVA